MEILSFGELKKNLKKEVQANTFIKVAILGDSATQLLTTAIKGYAVEFGCNLDIYEADYNQIQREVFDLDSMLYEFQPEFVIIFHSRQQLVKQLYGREVKRRKTFAKDHVEEVRDMFSTLTAGTQAKVVYYNIPVHQDSVFGNFSTKLEISAPFQFSKLNFLLMELASELSDLFVCDVVGLRARLGDAVTFDAKMYVHASMAFSLNFLPHLAKATLDIILAIRGRFKKCLILDLDNTIWGGVIGDDGISGIQIGNLGVGQAYTDLQEWALELKNRGIILGVCSKNTEHVALEPFEKHPDMVLRLKDISIFVANWENKADNLAHIQGVLNIGYDSMVFLDDNPFERNMVRTYLPEICVPELPEDPAEYLSYLQSLNLFETATYSENDQSRTRQYQDQAQRTTARQKFSNQKEFLKNLNMTCLVSGLNEFNTPRVAQLTQRSNQFNLRTVRYTNDDIARIAGSLSFIPVTYMLKDKFGDLGLICVVIMEKQDKETLFIDTWIMSCRVLKRGMENFVLNDIISAARKEGFKLLVGEYLPTSKNSIVAEHYHRLGFSKKDDKWILEVDHYEEQESFIENSDL